MHSQRINEEVDRLNNGKVYGLVPRTIISLLGLIAGLLSVMGLIGYLGSTEYRLGKTEYHKLPAVPRVLTEPPEQILIDDQSSYAQEEALSLYQYTSYSYKEGQLTEETGYDEQGRCIYQHTLEYDTAGNILRERVKSGTDEMQSKRHIYEYDDWERVVHEEVFQDEKLVERNYIRYTDEGCAGVLYSYLNEQVDGGISQYCANHTEFVENREGDLLCAFKMNSLKVENPNEVWKMQWQKSGGRLANRVQYYRDRLGRSHSRDWYLDIEQADGEQFNLYECVSETAERKLALQLNYEWQENSQAYFLIPAFYRAQYDGAFLQWQMNYAEGMLTFYSACLFDAEGWLLEAVEYNAEGEKPEARFHRYEYPNENRQDQYSYRIRGREFRFAFGDGDVVRLVFSGEGTLSGIEMTNVSENSREAYEFYDSGKNCGKLLRMNTDAETAEGETGVLKKLEEEAAAYGFRVGEDLTTCESGIEGGVD